MSKQSEAKEQQGYVAKPTWPVCGNCMNFRSDIKPVPWSTTHTQETNMRCGIGGFKVSKLGTCRHAFEEIEARWERRLAAQEERRAEAAEAKAQYESDDDDEPEDEGDDE